MMRQYSLIRACIIVAFSMLAFSCTKKQNNSDSFAPVTNLPPSIEIKSLSPVSFTLDKVESSYVGYLDMKQDSICLIDQRFASIFLFDKQGELKSRYLGLGGGAKEIDTGMIEGYADMLNSYFFIGPMRDCFIYDKDFSLQKKFILKLSDQSTTPSYDTPKIYTSTNSNALMKAYDKYVYYTVFSEYPGLSFIDSSDAYKDCYKNVHYLAKINTETGVLEDVLGHFPQVYQEDPAIKQFFNVHFDIEQSSGRFFVTFEADSLIYEYDKDFLPQRTYGYAGKNMQKATEIMLTGEDFQRINESSRQESGYNTGLKFIAETGLLFRSYHRGGSAQMDGLQIYRDGQLIGDVDVPKGFKLLGYHAPYYYGSTGVDEEAEKIEIYKFEI